MTVIGRIHTQYETKEIEWRIDDYFTVTQKCYHCDSATFSFADADVTYHLKCYPRWINDDKSVGLYLVRDATGKFPLEYTFGLRKCDGSVLQLVSGIMAKAKTSSDKINLIKKTELLRRKSELVPGDTLTIICTLKYVSEMSHSIQRNALDETRPLKLISLDKLSANFKDLYADKEGCDVTLKVKDREYKAHKSVLIARSSVFAAAFKYDTLESQTGVITIPDCDANSFQDFLEYLYSGKIEELSLSSALNLYYTSDKYDVEELKAFCVEVLMQSLTVDNVCEIAVFADKYEERQLYFTVQDFFNKNACKIFETSEWESLMKKDFDLGNKLLKAMSPNVKLADPEAEHSRKVKRLRLK